MDVDEGGEPGRCAAAGAWAEGAVGCSPGPLAVVDGHGRFVHLNPAAAQLCDLVPGTAVGSPSPFAPPPRGSAEPPGGPAELLAEWETAAGTHRAFSYAVRELADADRWVVAFRDVAPGRLHERRLAAVAKAATSVVARRSLTGTLDALAHEVASTNSLAGVQVLTAGSRGDRLHVMGVAGFQRAHDFFDKLLECRALGARLFMVDALRSGRPQVVQHRYATIMQDPAWAPLREHLGRPRWDSFVSVPLIVRDETVGVLNAFFAPGQEVGTPEVDFLLAMAEQAAVAVDHAAVLERERDVARHEERQRLARDLHDSVVQQVFSMMMQASSLGVLARRGLPPSPEELARAADELGSAAGDVLADLRGMVVELRPAVSPEQGLEPALRSLLETTTARTGLRLDLRVDDPAGALADLDPDVAEDVYRVVGEAVHNSVKHAGADHVDVVLAVVPTAGRRELAVEVVDDGRGLPGEGPGGRGDGGEGGAASSGYGIVAMRERAQRWGGQLQVLRSPAGGTTVRLDIPLLASIPVGPVALPVVSR